MITTIIGTVNNKYYNFLFLSQATTPVFLGRKRLLQMADPGALSTTHSFSLSSLGGSTWESLRSLLYNCTLVLFISTLEETVIDPEVASVVCVTTSFTEFPVGFSDFVPVTLALVGQNMSEIESAQCQILL